MDVAVALQRKKTIKILSIVDFSLSKQGIFFVLECRGFEQPAPAAAGRKSARWAVCEGAGESRHPTSATLYRVPVQTAFLSWSAEDSNSPSPSPDNVKPAKGFFLQSCEGFVMQSIEIF